MTAAPLIGVLALQGDVLEHTRALETAGARTMTVRRPEELERVDGLVLPGGESTTMWKLARTFDLLDPLRKRVEAGLPVYGSCAGMIMLADRIRDGIEGQETIGGIDMTVRRNAFGRQVDSFESDVLLTGMGDTPYHAVFIRAPWVETVGTAVEVLGRAESGRNAGRIVAVRQGRLVATAFHPELTGDYRVHHYFADLVRRATEQED
ncbi:MULTISPECIES: pyridoxal 5'-phosphate synthase glutaminase subunit PdxT [Thermomonosporaceae]|uniref:pyridoxal 5'-phosphate synthase glutaminase subunit PdxT n=1 Tax=Thermomonosporaceae TaxID=2012 RepID=UPI00255AE8D8|nr:MULTISPECIES: pyridoxal 5'-phosphate synthase glutaminase subunit PdxT [Thermomonosporaceae]MDL4777290.1 pyridoxal 5'-phosphate synthase glutaminase subunit PdxT [Actinomadura xylanilytica]